MSGAILRGGVGIYVVVGGGGVEEGLGGFAGHGGWFWTVCRWKVIKFRRSLGDQSLSLGARGAGLVVNQVFASFCELPPIEVL